MATVLDLITDALVTIKALAVGEPAPASMTTDAFTKFNEVLDSLSLQNLAVYATTDVVVPLVTGQAAYLLGPGGVGQRPLAMNGFDSSYCTFQGVDFDLEVVPKNEYDALATKITGGIPTWAAFDNGYPNATLYLWPVPYTTGTMTLSLKQQFTRAVALTDTFDMPPGYRKMIRLLLSWELLPDYPGMDAQSIALLEKSVGRAVGEVKRANIEPVTLRCEAADLGRNSGNYVDWRDGA